MRYWQHAETGRLLKTDVQMAPSKWIQLTKEQYERAKYERAKEDIENATVSPHVRYSE